MSIGGVVDSSSLGVMIMSKLGTQGRYVPLLSLKSCPSLASSDYSNVSTCFDC